MKRSLVVVGIGLLFVAGAALAKSKPHKTAGGAIEAKSGATLKGKAEFRQPDGTKEVTVKVDVEGAPEGVHAVHIHEKGDCSSPDGKSAGGHWNPTSDQHGQWGHDHFHLGDIGNMTVGKDGKGTIELKTDKWTIGGGGPNDIIGKSVIVHEKVDDFTTQPTGNAGNRIGCVVIAEQPGSPADKAASEKPAEKPAPAKTEPAKK
jgi:Cu-Zn family superoxide dismutase